MVLWPGHPKNRGPLAAAQLAQWVVNSVTAQPFDRHARIYIIHTRIWPTQQEAQLSQRDRATLRVIEYFAVSQDHSRSFEMTLLSRACVSPYQYSIETVYLVPFLRYSASKKGVTLKPGQRSFKIIENSAVRYIIYDFLLVGHCKYSSILYRYSVI